MKKRIKGAVNVPSEVLETKDLPEDVPVILYCNAICPTAADAAETLFLQGYKNARVIGGLGPAVSFDESTLPGSLTAGSQAVLKRWDERSDGICGYFCGLTRLHLVEAAAIYAALAENDFGFYFV